MPFTKQSRLDTLPPRPTTKQIAIAWLGSTLAIGSITGLGQIANLPLILGSLGASCVLVFGYPNAQFSQPRNLIAGHLLCSIIGLSFLKFIGSEWWCMALAVGTALAIMMATRTVHPPAGSNPVIIFLTQPDWQFLWFPTLSGVIILFCLSRLFLKITKQI